MKNDLDALSRALSRVCLAPEAPAADLLALGAPRDRWVLYRELVRNRVLDALGEALPRTRLAATPARFEAWCARWLDASPPRTRYVRELMPEFADWLERTPGARADLPAAFDDLLRYERALHRVALAPDPSPDALTAAPFAMDRPARFHPVIARLDVRWAVHRAAPLTEIPPCDEGTGALLIYRHPTRFGAQTLSLSPVAAAVLDAMIPGGDDVTSCVQRALAAHDLAVGAVFIESFAELLADLMERQVLLGAVP